VDDVASRLLRLASAYRVSQAVYVAAVLGLADRLSLGPMTAAELARDGQVDEAMLNRLLRLLAVEGLLEVTQDGAYRLTELGAGLRSDAPQEVRPWVLMFGEEQYQAWGALLHTIRTGEAAFDHVHGTDFWSYLAGHPAKSQTFNSVMADSSSTWGDLVASHCDLTGCDTLVDVGGGTGAVLASLLNAYPGLRGTLVDQPAAVAQARLRLGEEKILDRCQLVSGDFFVEVPRGADAYLLCRVLGDWSDAAAVRILRRCREAMLPSSRLIVVGGLVGQRRSAQQTALDMHLSVLVGGGDRGRDQYRELLRQASLAMSRCDDLAGTGSALIEAVPAHES
jgi:hypothetical protein